MKADYTAHLRVRSYECDSLGHVNNSIYLQYLQQITHEAQGQSPNPKGFWDVRALSIEYLAPAVDRDELEVETWVVERHAMGIARGYRIKRVSDSAPVVAARLDWVFRDPGGAALPVPEVGSPQGNLPSPLKPFFPPGDNSSTAFRWRHRVRRYELDASNRVAPTRASRRLWATASRRRPPRSRTNRGSSRRSSRTASTRRPRTPAAAASGGSTAGPRSASASTTSSFRTSPCRSTA